MAQTATTAAVTAKHTSAAFSEEERKALADKAAPKKLFIPVREEQPPVELENYRPSPEEIKRNIEKKKQELRMRTEQEKLLAGNWSGQFSSALLPPPPESSRSISVKKKRKAKRSSSTGRILAPTQMLTATAVQETATLVRALARSRTPTRTSTRSASRGRSTRRSTGRLSMEERDTVASAIRKRETSRVIQRIATMKVAQAARVPVETAEQILTARKRRRRVSRRL